MSAGQARFGSSAATSLPPSVRRSSARRVGSVGLTASLPARAVAARRKFCASTLSSPTPAELGERRGQDARVTERRRDVASQGGATRDEQHEDRGNDAKSDPEPETEGDA